MNTKVNPYPFGKYHAFFLGIITIPLILIMFNTAAIYIDGVNENYFKIFCNNKKKSTQ